MELLGKALIRAGRLSILALVLLASPARAAEAGCGGADLFPALKASSPAAFDTLLAQGRSARFGQGRLFQVSRAGVEPSTVFATLHVPDPRVTALPRKVLGRLGEARIVALELDIDERGRTRDVAEGASGRAQFQALATARPERRAERLLPAEDYARLRALLARRGLARSAAPQFKAGVLALLLGTPACAVAGPEGPPYLDAVLADLARKQRARLVGLETTVEQIDMLDGLSPDQEHALLVSLLRQDDRAEDILETSILRYVEGEIGALAAWTRSPELLPGVPGSGTPPAFLQRLVDERSRRMSTRVLPLLAEGRAFIAVGAAHLPGEAGLLALLEQEGYRVERIE